MGGDEVFIESKTPNNEPMKKAKVENKSFAKSGIVFFLPDDGNQITPNDIKVATLRITSTAAINFDRRNEHLNIEIKGQHFHVTYTPREGRSDLLRLGGAAMDLLGLKAGGGLKFTKLNNNSYKIEVVFS